METILLGAGLATGTILYLVIASIIAGKFVNSTEYPPEATEYVLSGMAGFVLVPFAILGAPFFGLFYVLSYFGRKVVN